MVQVGAFPALDITHLPRTSVKNYFILLHVDFASPQSDNSFQ